MEHFCAHRVFFLTLFIEIETNYWDMEVWDNDRILKNVNKMVLSLRGITVSTIAHDENTCEYRLHDIRIQSCTYHALISFLSLVQYA